MGGGSKSNLTHNKHHRTSQRWTHERLILAIQLQLEDIAEILNDLQGTQKLADNDHASLETIQRGLVQQLATLEGQVLVIKLLEAEFDQRAAYKKLLDEER